MGTRRTYANLSDGPIAQGRSADIRQNPDATEAAFMARPPVSHGPRKVTASNLDYLRLLTVKEVADILSCSEKFVWKMVYRREIESVIIGKRARRIRVTAVKELIESRLIPAYGEDPYGRMAARFKRASVTCPKKGSITNKAEGK